jgi:hypothetical protein
MLAFSSAAPVDSRPLSRLSEAHIHSVPVVLEQPRPLPHGLGDSAW